MVDSPMVPVIVPGDETAQLAIDRLSIGDIPSSQIARSSQPYTVQIPVRSRVKLVKNGHAAFLHPDLRGDQFCVLNNIKLYHSDSGLWWKEADYLAEELWMI